MKRYFRRLAFLSGFPHAKITWRRLAGRGRIFILMYHRVEYQSSPFFEVVVRPDDFEKQILFLKRYFEIVDLCNLKRLELNQLLKKDVVVLTFDDGYRDNYTHAFPILKKHKVPATIFLPTHHINSTRLLWYDKLAWILYKTTFSPDTSRFVTYDIPREISLKIDHFFNSPQPVRMSILHVLATKLKVFPTKDRDNILSKLAQVCKIEVRPTNNERAMLSWEEIQEMSTHGVSFGSHTVSHPVLSAISTSEAREEIVESKRVIEDKIQKPVTTFAYPYGKEGDYSDHIIKILEDSGFEYACTTNIGCEQFPLKTPLALKRKGAPPRPYLFL